MRPNLARFLYLGLQDIRGIPVRSCLSQLEKTQQLSAEDLRKFQWQRLKETLKHAYDHVPYYRRTWSALKLDPDQINNPEDYRRIPLLAKQDVRQYAKELQADDIRTRPLRRFTSGSTGIPLGIVQDGRARAAVWAAKYRGHRWHGVDIGDRTAWIRGMPLRGVARLTKRLQDAMANGLRLFPNDISPQSAEQFHRSLRRFQPSLLEGYPSALYQLARMLCSQQLDGRALGLRLIVTGGEVLDEFQRAFLQDVFGCPVADEYGCAEVGILGFECPAGRSHIPLENVYVETISSANAARASSSELVVTSLVNGAMPFIRYRLGDWCQIDASVCRCGRVAPTVSGLDGKVSSFVRASDGRWLHDSVIREVIHQIEERHLGVDQIRFTQQEDGGMAVEIVQGDGFRPEAPVVIEEALKAALGASLGVRIRLVEHIAPKYSGKFCYFVSNLSGSAHEAGQVVERDGTTQAVNRTVPSTRESTHAS